MRMRGMATDALATEARRDVGRLSFTATPTLADARSPLAVQTNLPEAATIHNSIAM